MVVEIIGYCEVIVTGFSEFWLTNFKDLWLRCCFGFFDLLTWIICFLLDIIHLNIQFTPLVPARTFHSFINHPFLIQILFLRCLLHYLLNSFITLTLSCKELLFIRKCCVFVFRVWDRFPLPGWTGFG